MHTYIHAALAAHIAQRVATPAISRFFHFHEENFVIESRITKFTKNIAPQKLELYDI